MLSSARSGPSSTCQAARHFSLCRGAWMAREVCFLYAALLVVYWLTLSFPGTSSQAPDVTSSSWFSGSPLVLGRLVFGHQGSALCCLDCSFPGPVPGLPVFYCQVKITKQNQDHLTLLQYWQLVLCWKRDISPQKHQVSSTEVFHQTYIWEIKWTIWTCPPLCLLFVWLVKICFQIKWRQHHTQILTSHTKVRYLIVSVLWHMYCLLTPHPPSSQYTVSVSELIKMNK